jgi:tetratricopeptide (TPR) repeat protein
MTRRVVAIALIFMSAACSSVNREVAIRSVNSEAVAAGQDALARGDLLFSRGEHALALDAYRRAIRQNPADAHALNGVAISYAAMGRHDLARDYFELALARAPQDERIHRNFARSLMAQGLPAEANALLAQIGQGATHSSARRPTLAELAAAGAGARMVGPVQAAGLELERMSLGEVRLRTLAVSATRPVLPGRMTSQLNTAIVTVADARGNEPTISLSRELKAPIVEMAAGPRAAEAKRAASLGCAAKGARLPATGYSIDLVPLGSDAKTSQACPTMAGGDEPESMFEKLWKWSGERG